MQVDFDPVSWAAAFRQALRTPGTRNTVEHRHEIRRSIGHTDELLEPSSIVGVALVNTGLVLQDMP